MGTLAVRVLPDLLNHLVGIVMDLAGAAGLDDSCDSLPILAICFYCCNER